MAIQVIDRAVRIIRVVAQCGPASLTCIGTRVELPLPTVARIVNSLVDNGILQRLDNRKYQLGARLLPLATSLDPFRKLLQLAHPFIEGLTETTGEDCGFAVLQGNEAVVVDWCYGPRMPRIIEPFVREVPLHCAFGIVLVAFQPADWRQRFLRTTSLKRMSSGTVPDREQLMERIERTRRTGIHFSRAENVEGAGSLAVPVFNKVSRLAGALFVTAPLDRLSDSDIRSHKTAVVSAGKSLSSALCGATLLHAGTSAAR
jgi:DNA-binding IclR family transcriptional regulator